MVAINQVFDILSTYFETPNWPEALKKGISSRKVMFFRAQWEDGPKIAAAEQSTGGPDQRTGQRVAVTHTCLYLTSLGPSQ